MIDVTRDIRTLTDFKRQTTVMIRQLKKSGRPVVLTVKGKAEAVVMDASTYQRLAERLSAIEGIQRGLAQAKKGKGRGVDEVFDALERE
jgi:prevent-host-death family protein